MKAQKFQILALKNSRCVKLCPGKIAARSASSSSGTSRFHKLLHHQQSLLITFKYCLRLQKSLNIRAAIAASY
ncbi:hypothetical protein [Microcoleus sp. CAWBG640]|uniref:hypothetical protein n=1 Tax=Microcoleus sp. CAWBG640 TaxID=2841653 RepID=UPI00312B4976